MKIDLSGRPKSLSITEARPHSVTGMTNVTTALNGVADELRKTNENLEELCVYLGSGGFRDADGETRADLEKLRTIAEASKNSIDQVLANIGNGQEEHYQK